MTKPISRRSFLRRLFVLTGSVTAGTALPGCGFPSARQTALPATTTAAATKTPAAAAASAAAAAQPSQLPAKSRLVRTSHPGVWNGEVLSEEALGQMIDSSIAALTGFEDAGKAWASLFHPGERVAIKVNAIISGSSSVPLVMAVAARLQDAGIPAEKITIYDRTSEELKNSGFSLNTTGKGLRCFGSDGSFTEQSWRVLDSDVYLSRVLAECDALINIPVLKGLTLGGLSFALKNHYGSINNPSRFHNERFTGGITGLNALDVIRSKTRLILADILAKETHADWTNYAVIGGNNTILASADPVTVDQIGLLMAVEALQKKGLNPQVVRAQADDWLKAGAVLGLGTNDIRQIDLKEIRL